MDVLWSYKNFEKDSPDNSLVEVGKDRWRQRLAVRIEIAKPEKTVQPVCDTYAVRILIISNIRLPCQGRATQILS